MGNARPEPRRPGGSLVVVRGNDRRVAPRLWLALALAAAFGARRLPAAPSADGLAAALAAEDRAALATDVDRRGDAARGATVFHTRHLTCTQCHVAGAGVSPLGPNLAAMPEGVPPSQLTSYLLEALLEPSAVIRPAFRGVTVITADGRSRSGIVARESADELVLRDAAALPPDPAVLARVMPRLVGMRSADMRRAEIPPATAATYATNRNLTTPPGSLGPNSWLGWARSFLLRALGVVATSGSSRSSPIRGRSGGS
jgi:putative heme-binding domain-containing protein